jgi:Mn2+/Fe2+ NRAMP family transporter
MSFVIGVMLLVASVVAFWFALPQGGEIRSFLRNDDFQAYFAVAILGALVMGLLYTGLGLVSLFS